MIIQPTSGNLFKVGITGGIGSGKTSVCRVFEVLGVPVFSADRVAATLTDTDSTIINGINSITGRDLYKNGNLNRAELASLIFNDKVLLQKVNDLVHPAVFESFRNWVNAQSADYVIMEAAILFESGAAVLVDRKITVTAPVEERIERIMERSKISREQVVERMNNQIDDDARIRLSDYVISNSENEMIIPAIIKIHEDILQLLKTHKY